MQRYYLWMLSILLLELLIIIKRHPLPVPHHGELLTSSCLPQPQAHLVRGGDHVLVVQTPRNCSQSLHPLRMVHLVFKNGQRYTQSIFDNFKRPKMSKLTSLLLPLSVVQMRTVLS